MILTKVFDHPNKWTILAGAGISIPPPSNIFSGYQTIDGILNAISPNDETKEFLLSLANSERIDRITEADFIRFELILDILQRHKDPKLTVLDFLDDKKFRILPNNNHHLLAKPIESGVPVLTTNFDCLIEKASEITHREISTLVYEKDFCDFLENPTRKEESPYPLFKIHGSVFKNGNYSKDSIVSTIESIGSAGYKFSYEEGKKEVIKWLLRNFNLLVIGYSGYDDFDISPLIEEVKSHMAVVWIDHNPHVISISVGPEVIHNAKRYKDSSLERRVLSIFSKMLGTNIRDIRRVREPEKLVLIEADATIVLENFLNFIVPKANNSISSHVSYSEELLDISQISPYEYFNYWARSLNFSEADRLIASGELLKRLGRNKISAEILAKALKKIDKRDFKKLGNCYFHIGDIHYNLDDFYNSLTNYKKSSKLLQKAGNENKALEAVILSEYSNFIVSEFKSGIKKLICFYEEAKSTDFADGLCKIPFLFGTIYEAIGSFEEAEIMFQYAIRLAKERHNINLLVKSYVSYSSLLHNKANNLIQHYESEPNFERKAEILSKMLDFYKIGIEYANKGSYLSKRFGLILDDGIARFNLAGGLVGLTNYEKAIDYYQQALEIFRKIGESNREQMTLNAIDLTYMRISMPNQRLLRPNSIEWETSYIPSDEDELIGLSEHEELTEIFLSPENAVQGILKMDEDTKQRIRAEALKVALKLNSILNKE